jgi:hypothetical protein
VTSKFQTGKRAVTAAQLDKKERKVNRRRHKAELAKAIVRNAQAEGICSLAKPGAAKKLVDRLLRTQLHRIKLDAEQAAAQGEVVFPIGVPGGGHD